MENVALATLGGLGVWLVYRSLTTPPRVRLSKDLERISGEDEGGFMAGLQTMLDQAGFQITAHEYLAVSLGLGCVAALVSFLLTGQVAMIAVSLALAPVLYWSVLEARRDTATREYREALADAADIIRNTFETVPNVQHAIRAVAEDGPPAVQGDFQSILTGLSGGASLEEAMAPIARKRQDLFFDMLAEALCLREEEGGSIRDVLDSIARLIREQARIYRESIARQTQARMEANVVCVAPFVFFIVAKVFLADYMNPFYATPMGQAVVGIVAILDAIAFWMTGKIARAGMDIVRVEQQ